MITTINIRISSGHVNMPLPMSAVFAGSAATFMIEGVPNSRNGIAITSCTVRVTNAAGTVMDVTASRQGAGWTATFPATHFANAGSVSKGVTVSCGGTDESNNATTWRLGSGDLVTIALDASATNLGVLQHVNYRTTEPSTPVAGDLCKVNGVWKLYDGSAWQTFGGGVSDYDALTSRPQIGGVTLTGNKSLGDLGAASETSLTAHTGATNNPHAVTKSQVGLGNCDNTSDANKPISTATQNALNGKAGNSSPSITGWVNLQGQDGSVPGIYIGGGWVSIDENNRITIGGDVAASVNDLPYSAESSDAAPEARMVRYYKIDSSTTLPLAITLPTISAYDTTTVNLDLVIDASEYTTADPEISISTGGAPLITKGAEGITSVTKGEITVLDFTSIPGYGDNGGYAAAWLVMSAGEFGKVVTNG